MMRFSGGLELGESYAPMQDVTPKVVAIAVSTVMRMFRILLQRFLLLSIGQMIVESG